MYNATAFSRVVVIECNFAVDMWLQPAIVDKNPAEEYYDKKDSAKHTIYKKKDKIGITSRMGSFKAFLVSLNLVSSFSSCLDKTLMMVAELRISSSTFSSLPTKPTTTPSLFALQILRHCLQRITLPTTTAPTSSEYCKTKILLPNDV